MLSTTEEQVEESENYFISMTDIMVGMLFIFIIMLMVFAVRHYCRYVRERRVQLGQVCRVNASRSVLIHGPGGRS